MTALLCWPTRARYEAWGSSSSPDSDQSPCATCLARAQARSYSESAKVPTVASGPRPSFDEAAAAASVVGVTRTSHASE